MKNREGKKEEKKLNPPKLNKESKTLVTNLVYGLLFKTICINEILFKIHVFIIKNIYQPNCSLITKYKFIYTSGNQCNPTLSGPERPSSVVKHYIYI